MEHNSNLQRKSKLWIIDDEPSLTYVYSSYFTRYFEVETFNSATHAIEALKNKRVPDVILSDMKMPEMDGLAFVKTVRDVGFEMPIVMISGYAEKTHLLQAMNSQVQRFVEKPCTPSEIKSVIDEVLLCA